MRRFHFKILILLSLATWASSAFAGLLFEPYAGYSVGDFSYTYSNTYTDAALRGEDVKGDIQGVAFGGRLAWKFTRFFIGGDYQGMKGNETVKGLSESSTFTNTSIFGVLGWEFFSGFRLYGGVTVKPHTSIRNDSATETEFTGSAQKIGIGYRYSAPIAINAEYVMYKFSEFTEDGVKGDIKDYYQKMDYNAVVVSISFPFHFGGGR